MNKLDEQILVVNRKHLFNDEKLHFQGYRKTGEVPELSNRLMAYEVRRRGDMENDESFKQLITYAVIQDKETGEYLYSKRLSKGGEKRLEGNISIGIGGHTNEAEGGSGWFNTIEELLYENAYRELNEELILGEAVTLEQVGYVNNEEDAVGRVHLGVVYCAEVSRKDLVKCGEPDVLALGWSSLEDLKKEERLEDWASIIINSTVTNI